jgi:hypothetical protein
MPSRLGLGPPRSPPREAHQAAALVRSLARKNWARELTANGRTSPSILHPSDPKNGMNRYPNIVTALRTLFNSQDGFSEELSRELFLRSIKTSGREEHVRHELQLAFEDPEVSWTRLLENDDYEIHSAEIEDEAREYARRNLWVPIFGNES